MQRHSTYDVDFIFELMDTTRGGKVTLPSGHRFRKNSGRIQLFKEKGIVCVTCAIEGQFFALESVGDETPHLNLYAVGAKGEDVLMTKDHVFPRSLGGANSIENYQTMCSPCNGKKADKIVETVVAAELS